MNRALFARFVLYVGFVVAMAQVSENAFAAKNQQAELENHVRQLHRMAEDKRRGEPIAETLLEIETKLNAAIIDLAFPKEAPYEISPIDFSQYQKWAKIAGPRVLEARTAQGSRYVEAHFRQLPFEKMEYLRTAVEFKLRQRGFLPGYQVELLSALTAQNYPLALALLTMRYGADRSRQDGWKTISKEMIQFLDDTSTIHEERRRSIIVELERHFVGDSDLPRLRRKSNRAATCEAVFAPAAMQRD